MDPARHQQIKQAFLEVCELAGSEREECLARLAGQDPELRDRVEALLASDARSAPMPDVGHSPQPATPESIGDYRIVRRIGDGGMGVVYEAEQLNPRRRVALKVMRAELGTAELRARFQYEAQLLGRLEHPGIARVYEAATTGDGQPYFAMEFINGDTLTGDAGVRELPVSGRLELFAHICDAVHHAHLQGVIHRDLKPANILIDGAGQPRVLDFGVARAADSELRSTILRTHTGQLVGTVPYMSPEQATGDPDELDVRSDVYSLGVILHELLTGDLPYSFDGKSLYDCIRIIREHEPTRVSVVDRRLRGDVETILGRTLEKRKQDRYASAAELAADVRRFLADEPIRARPTTALYQLGKFARRNRMLVGAAAMLLVVLVVGVAVSTTYAIQASRARSEAEDQVSIADEVIRFLNEDLLASVSPERGGHDVRVREILDNAAAAIGNRFDGKPRVEASLRATLGNTYERLGELDLAEPHLLRALELRESELGPEHVETLDSRSDLALLRYAQGRYEESRRMWAEVVADHQRLLGQHHHRTAVARNQLGMATKILGNYEEAERIYLRALEAPELAESVRLSIQTHLADLYQAQSRWAESDALFEEVIAARTRLLGAEHPRTLMTRYGHAELLMLSGKNQQAAEILEEVVSIRERVQGPDHLQTIKAQAALVKAYSYQGQRDKAEPVLTRVLATRRERLGADHFDTLMSLHDLGSLYMMQGRTAEAEPLVRQAYEDRTRVLGAEHPATLVSGNTLAILVRRLGKLDEAEALYRRTLEGQREVLGPEHQDTLQVTANLGALYMRQGRLDEAEPMLSEVLGTRRRLLGDDHPSTLSTGHEVAILYQRQGKLVEAERLMEAIWKGRREALGDEHFATLLTGNGLGQIYASRGRFQDAARIARRVVEAQRRVIGDRHPFTMVYVANLGGIERALGRYRESEEFYVAAMEMLRAGDTKNNRRAPVVLGGLAQTLHAQARHPEARALYQEAIELGESHGDVRRVREYRVRLATLRAQTGDIGAAEQLLRENVALETRENGAEAPATLASQSALGLVCTLQGQHQEAGRVLTETLGRQRAELGEHQPATLITTLRLGEAQAAGGTHQEARALFATAASGFAAINPEAHPLRARALLGAGLSAVALGDAATARAELLEAQQILNATVPAEHPDARAVAAALEELGG